jgi:hypothetical protein
MERMPSAEKLASVNLDAFLAVAQPVSDVIDGKMMQSMNHLFYYWASKTFPQFRNIDGVSLEDLYLKNVVETEMDEATFSRYCDTHGFPYPKVGEVHTGDKNYYDVAFEIYLNNEEELRKESYETWCEQNGISTASGTVMRFNDLEGNEFRVRTDYENRGQIIAD